MRRTECEQCATQTGVPKSFVRLVAAETLFGGPSEEALWTGTAREPHDIPRRREGECNRGGLLMVRHTAGLSVVFRVGREGGWLGGFTRCEMVEEVRWFGGYSRFEMVEEVR